MDTALRKRPSYFLMISIAGVLAAFIGFAKTFFLPLSTGDFKAPVVVHVHGVCAFAWIILFFVQNICIHRRRYILHKRLGVAGIIIAAGVFITLFFVGRYTVDKQLANGITPSGYNDLPGVITGAVLFFGLVCAGIINRKRSSYHKRYLLLATVVVLWPAWFRFRHYFPNVPYPEYWFALVLPYSLIVIAWIWEYYKYGAIHPVLRWMGLFIITEQTLEQLAYDSSIWRMGAKWLYGFLYTAGSV
ncbi:hypothetical protein [Niabella drilacis]|uniref:DUF2306 domain-containing protein n=1 Tax=Niabella drilacis (strain DSM 25811 / CCM 8410 / CCUG 62505 / LMG 26954 / E90) TaxID=1285928 RepID=A0A1G7C6Q6_NIADE|nr:hypothetical protein [Niabella drilacis]SDE34977.1 hypothetical protein SAMN04487894_1404 [Niabella drilacis]